VIFGLLFSAGIILLAVPMLVYGVKGGRKNDKKVQDIVEIIE
jgi:hypothetical protein